MMCVMGRHPIASRLSELPVEQPACRKHYSSLSGRGREREEKENHVGTDNSLKTQRSLVRPCLLIRNDSRDSKTLRTTGGVQSHYCRSL